jgi:putative endonuclease
MTAAHNRSLGEYGEELAARYLREHEGMAVLDRNWRCRDGEIDLVLRDGDVLVICEVKTRSTQVGGHPLEAVGLTKLARLRRLAARWIIAHDVRVNDVRLDLVGVYQPRRGAAVIDHVAGVG